ncbi:MAG: hypothetical protein Alpg2KO_08120 [Alphaproteobacteria bacterium]
MNPYVVDSDGNEQFDSFGNKVREYNFDFVSKMNQAENVIFLPATINIRRNDVGLTVHESHAQALFDRTDQTLEKITELLEASSISPEQYGDVVDGLMKEISGYIRFYAGVGPKIEYSVKDADMIRLMYNSIDKMLNDIIVEANAGGLNDLSQFRLVYTDLNDALTGGVNPIVSGGEDAVDGAIRDMLQMADILGIDFMPAGPYGRPTPKDAGELDARAMGGEVRHEWLTKVYQQVVQYNGDHGDLMADIRAELDGLGQPDATDSPLQKFRDLADGIWYTSFGGKPPQLQVDTIDAATLDLKKPDDVLVKGALNAFQDEIITALESGDPDAVEFFELNGEWYKFFEKALRLEILHRKSKGELPKINDLSNKAEVDAAVRQFIDQANDSFGNDFMNGHVVGQIAEKVEEILQLRGQSLEDALPDYKVITTFAASLVSFITGDAAGDSISRFGEMHDILYTSGGAGPVYQNTAYLISQMGKTVADFAQTSTAAVSELFPGIVAGQRKLIEELQSREGVDGQPLLSHDVTPEIAEQRMLDIIRNKFLSDETFRAALQAGPEGIKAGFYGVLVEAALGGVIGMASGKTFVEAFNETFNDRDTLIPVITEVLAGLALGFVGGVTITVTGGIAIAIAVTATYETIGSDILALLLDTNKIVIGTPEHDRRYITAEEDTAWFVTGGPLLEASGALDPAFAASVYQAERSFWDRLTGTGPDPDPELYSNLVAVIEAIENGTTDALDPDVVENIEEVIGEAFKQGFAKGQYDVSDGIDKLSIQAPPAQLDEDTGEYEAFSGDTSVEIETYNGQVYITRLGERDLNLSFDVYLTSIERLETPTQNDEFHLLSPGFSFEGNFGDDLFRVQVADDPVSDDPDRNSGVGVGSGVSTLFGEVGNDVFRVEWLDNVATAGANPASIYGGAGLGDVDTVALLLEPENGFSFATGHYSHSGSVGELAFRVSLSKATGFDQWGHPESTAVLNDEGEAHWFEIVESEVFYADYGLNGTTATGGDDYFWRSSAVSATVDEDGTGTVYVNPRNVMDEGYDYSYINSLIDILPHWKRPVSHTTIGDSMVEIDFDPEILVSGNSVLTPHHIEDYLGDGEGFWEEVSLELDAIPSETYYPLPTPTIKVAPVWNLDTRVHISTTDHVDGVHLDVAQASWLIFGSDGWIEMPTVVDGVLEYDKAVYIDYDSVRSISSTFDGSESFRVGFHNVKVYGESIDDQFVGSTSGTNQDFFGGGGNDHMFGGGGNDKLHGEDGDDHLYTSVGFDTLEGGYGRDTIHLGFYEGDGGAFGPEDWYHDAEGWVYPLIEDPVAGRGVANSYAFVKAGIGDSADIVKLPWHEVTPAVVTIGARMDDEAEEKVGTLSINGAEIMKWTGEIILDLAGNISEVWTEDTDLLTSDLFHLNPDGRAYFLGSPSVEKLDLSGGSVNWDIADWDATVDSVVLGNGDDRVAGEGDLVLGGDGRDVLVLSGHSLPSVIRAAHGDSTLHIDGATHAADGYDALHWWWYEPGLMEQVGTGTYYNWTDQSGTLRTDEKYTDHFFKVVGQFDYIENSGIIYKIPSNLPGIARPWDPWPGPTDPHWSLTDPNTWQQVDSWITASGGIVSTEADQSYVSVGHAHGLEVSVGHSDVSIDIDISSTDAGISQAQVTDGGGSIAGIVISGVDAQGSIVAGNIGDDGELNLTFETDGSEGASRKRIAVDVSVDSLMVDGFGGYGLDDATAGSPTRGQLVVGSRDGNVMSGTGFADLVLGSKGVDLLGGDAGNDWIVGGGGTDTLLGGVGDDFLNGGRHSDVLDGGIGSDFLSGGLGRDSYIFRVGDGRDVVDETDGNIGFDYTDELVLSDLTGLSDVTLGVSDDSDLVIGYGADDAITIRGQFAADATMVERLVFGLTAGSDVAIRTSKVGALGDDILLVAESGEYSGAGGVDWYIGDVAAFDASSIHGFDSDDRILVWGVEQNQWVHDEITGHLRFDTDGDGQLDASTALTGAPDTKLFAAHRNDGLLFEWRSDGSVQTATIGAQTLNGSAGDDRLDAGFAEQEVSLFGGDGDDILVLRNFGGTADGGSGDDLVYGGIADDELSGGDGADHIRGGAGHDLIYGGIGSDTLSGGVGYDRFVGSSAEWDGDTVTDFGIGDRLTLLGTGLEAATVVWNDVSDALTVDLEADGTVDALIEVGGSFDDLSWTITSAEISVIADSGWVLEGVDLADDRLTGSTGGDTLRGRGAHDVLMGAEGADTLEAGDGADILVGGADADLLTGGAGLDRFEGSLGDLDGDTITDLVAGEHVVLTDAPILSAGEFFWDSTAEQVTIDVGNDGSVEAVLNLQGVSNVSLQTSESGLQSLVVQGPWNLDLDQLGTNDRDSFGVVLSGGDDVVLGSGGDDTVYGLAGADDIDGVTGDDRIYGGEGDDTLTGGDGNDYIEGGSGVDTVTGGSGRDTFAGSVADLSEDIITDFSIGDVLRITGQTLTAGQVAFDQFMGTLDVTDGVESVSFNLANAFAVSVAVTYDGNDTLVSFVSGFGLPAPGDLVGTEQADQLATSSGVLSVYGLGGDDVIIGGSGLQNSLIGGLGSDLYRFEGQLQSNDYILEQGLGTAGADVDVVQITGITDVSDLEFDRDLDGLVYTGTSPASSDDLIMRRGGVAKSLNLVDAFDDQALGHVEKLRLGNTEWVIRLGDDGRDTNDIILVDGDHQEYQTFAGQDVLVGRASEWAGKSVLDFGEDDALRIVAADLTDMDWAHSSSGLIFDFDRDGSYESSVALNTDAHSSYDVQLASGIVEVRTSLADGPTMGQSSEHIVASTDGNDWLYLGDAQAAYLSGGLGDDRLVAIRDDSQVTVVGNAGDDTLIGSSLMGATLEGGDGDDVLRAGAGNDTLVGGQGADVMSGFGGFDRFTGSMLDFAGDHITDFGQGDKIELYDVTLTGANVTFSDVPAGLTSDIYRKLVEIDSDLDGVSDVSFIVDVERESYGPTPDLFVTNNGWSTVLTTAGGWTLSAPDNGGWLQGSAGADNLTGSDYSDWIEGGAGADILSGGLGPDVFSASQIGDFDGDQITDFEEGDRISIDLFTGAAGAAGAAGAGAGTGTSTFTPIIDFDSSTSELRIDVEDDGTWDATLTLVGFTGQLIYVDQAGMGEIVALPTGPVSGTSSGDNLTGTHVNDIINGLDGNDWISGFEGDDTLNGGAGRDTLQGGMGQDILTGGAGLDIFEGSLAELDGDTLTDFSGGDVIRLHNVILSAANITYAPVGGELSIDEDLDGLIDHVLSLPDGILDAFVVSDDGWATEIRLDLPIVFEGGDEADFVTGTVWSDHFDGGAGADNLNGGEGDDLISGGGGGDYLAGGDGNDTLHGNSGKDWLYGEVGDDTLYGGGGDDSLNGYDGHDVLHGGKGDDILNGDYGDDILFGNQGDDFLRGYYGDDQLFGGEGYDRTDYWEYSTQAQVTRVAGGVEVISQNFGTDFLLGVEEIQFWDQNIHVENSRPVVHLTEMSVPAGGWLDMSSLVVQVDDQDSDPVLEWKVRLGTASGANSTELWMDQIQLSSDSWTRMSASEFSTLAVRAIDRGVDTLHLQAFDGFEWSSEAVVLLGALGAGLIGGAEDNVFRLDQGDGSVFISDTGGIDVLVLQDTWSIDEVARGVRWDPLEQLPIETLTFGTSTVVQIDAETQIEFIQLADGTQYRLRDLMEVLPTTGVYITGSEGADVITGSERDDILEGLDEDDIFIGTAGSDVIRGGDGTDVVDYSGFSNDLLIDLVASTVTDGVFTDTLDGVESAVSGAGDDVFVVASTIASISGGMGRDTVDLSASVQAVNVILGSMPGWTGIEAVTGSGLDDTLQGDGENNHLAGGAGDDVFVVTGFDDFDVVSGGAGLDIIQLSAPIAMGQLILSRVQDDLRISVDGSPGYLTLEGHFDQLAEAVEVLEFSDGSTFDLSVVRNSFPVLSGLPLVLELTESGGPLDFFIDDPDGDVGDLNFEVIIEDPDIVDPDSVFVTASGNSYQLMLSPQINMVQGNTPVTFRVTDIDGNVSQWTTYVTIGSANASLWDNRAKVDGDVVELQGDATGTNHLTGSYSDDVLNGGAGTDLLQGGAGDDVLLPGEGAGHLDGGDGDDAVSFAAVGAGVSIDTLSGDADVNGLRVTFGSIENWILTEFDDVIHGGAELNSVSAGSGDDVIFDQGGINTYDGGDGFDEIDYSAALRGIAVDLSQGTIRVGAETDAVSRIERVVASGYDDTLSGSVMADSLDGADGDDTFVATGGDDWFVGGVGFDTASYAHWGHGIVFDQSTGIVNKTGGSDQILDVEAMIGSDADDVFSLIAQMVVDGGEGVDVVDLTSALTGVTVVLDGTGLSLSNVEEVLGTNFGDHIELDDVGVRIVSGTGDDSLFGGAGEDVFVLNGGDDSIVGGLGFDTVDYSHITSDITVDLSVGSGSWGAFTSSFDLVERVLGGSGNDLLIGSTEREVFGGGGGDDVIVSGTINDEVNGGAGVDVLDLTRHLVGVDLDAMLVTDIERIIGSHHNDYLPVLDRIVEGSLGDDLYLLDDPTGVVIEQVDEGFDVLVAYVSFDLPTHVEVGLVADDAQSALTLNGSAGDDVLSALNFDYAPTFVHLLHGGGGNDTFIATSSADLDGGLGVDTVTFEPGPAGAILDLDLGIVGYDEFELRTLANVENAIGSGFDDELIGDQADNVFEGLEGNDVLAGLEGDDDLFGGAGDDILMGGLGNDLLDGGLGVDTASFDFQSLVVFADLVLGTAQIGVDLDTLIAVENLEGGIADDDLRGDVGANALSGLEGHDTLYGREGEDSLIGGLGDDTLDGGDHADSLFGGEGDDLLLGAAGGDHLNGGVGSDELIGGAQDDVLIGGLGDDTYVIAAGDGSDQITDIGGADRLVLSGLASFNDITIQRVGNDLQLAWTNGDVTTVSGHFAGTSLEQISFVLDDGSGPVQHDFVLTPDQAGGGAELHLGTIDFASETQGVTIDLAAVEGQVDPLYTDNSGAQDLLIDVTDLTGSDHADVMTGNSLSNTIDGGTGDDVISGGVGHDTLDGGFGDDQLYGGQGDDTLRGGDGADTLVAGEGVDILRGGLGADTLTGGSGADSFAGSLAELNGDVITDFALEDALVLVADLPPGWSASTVFGLEYDHATGQLAIDQDDDGTVEASLTVQGLANPGSFTFAPIGFHFDGTVALWGLSFVEQSIITGTSGFDFLTGTSGDDILQGLGGFDLLFGSLGADVMDGGADIDMASYRNSSEAVTIDLEAGIASGGEAAGDTLISIEAVEGSALDDTLTGDALGNSLFGLEGADQLTGGAGADSLFGGLGVDTLTGGDDLDSFGGTFAEMDGDTVTDLAAGEALVFQGDGASFDPNLVTFSYDQVTGILSVDQEGDGTIDAAVTLLGDHSAGSFNLTVPFTEPDGTTWEVRLVYSEASVINGTSGDDNLAGTIGDDELYGLGGFDVLNGSEGADVLDGGDDIDAASYQGSSVAVQVDLGAGTATGGDADGDTLVSIESLEGSAYDDTLTGDAGNNTLTGMDGADALSGGDGSDWLYGGAGTDTLTGGLGQDFFGGSFAAMNGDAITDLEIGESIVLFGDAPFDVSLMTLSYDAQTGMLDVDQQGDGTIDATISLTGDYSTGSFAIAPQFPFPDGTALAATVTYQESVSIIGTADADWLEGSSGDDDIYGLAGFDDLIGSEGADLMDGGDDIDTARYGASFDAISIDLAAGTASGGYAAGDTLISIENLEGSNYDDSLTGDANGNSLFGMDGADTVSGGDGNDWLSGGSGVDTLTGGAGQDTFVGSFAQWDGDTITDFSAGETIAVQGNGASFDPTLVVVSHDANTNILSLDQDGDGTIDANIQLQGDFSAGGFSVSVPWLMPDGTAWEIHVAYQEGQTLNGTADSDWLEGSAVDDQIYALAGFDTLVGGAGADVLDGGDDIDTASWYSSAAGVMVDLSAGTASGGDATGDTLISIENLEGSAHADTLTGDDRMNSLTGAAGDDVLDGGAGSDFLSGGSGADILTGGSGVDRFSGTFAELDGDTITDLEAGESIELLDWSAPFDPTLASFSFDDTTDSLSIDLQGDGTADATMTLLGDHSAGVFSLYPTWTFGDGTTHSLTLAYDGPVVRTGTAASEWLGGGSYDDVLDGMDGDDTLDGFDGNDVLIGGLGIDWLYGGAGDDTYRFAVGDGTDYVVDNAGLDTLEITGVNGLADLTITDDGNNLNISFSSGDLVVIQDFYIAPDYQVETLVLMIPDGQGGYTSESHDLVSLAPASGGGDLFLSGSEGADTLTGADGNDSLYGHGDDDILSGGAGNDYLSGGEGADTLDGGTQDWADWAGYFDSSAGVTVDLDLATAQVSAGQADGDILIDIENIDGSGSYDDILSGNAVSNTIFGWGGNDQIIGRGGADSLFGNDGNDVIDGGAGADYLSGGVGDDTLTGGSGTDIFQFEIGGGADLIEDFTSNEDTLDLVAFAIGDFAALQAVMTVIDTDSDAGFDSTLIDFGSGDTITIQGVLSSSIDQNDLWL